MAYQVVNDEIRKSLMILLRPLVQINFILGTCPCLISSEGQIKTPLKYFNFARFFFIVGVLIFFSVSPFVRGCVSMLGTSTEYVDKTYFPQARNEAVGASLTKYVDMTCGFYANLIPAVFLCLASCKRKQILEFLNTMINYVNGIAGFADYDHVKRVTTRLFVMHGIFGLTMSAMLALRFISVSGHGPGTLALWFFFKEGSESDQQWILWSIAPFYAYLSVAKTAVTALIEVSCVALSCCFCKVIEQIQNYLNEVMSNWSRRFLDDPLSSSIINQRPSSRDPEAVKHSPQHHVKTRKIQNDFENYLEQIRGSAGLSLSNGNDRMLASGRIRGDFCDFQETTPGQQILYVIDKFQTVRNMQTAVNGLFGFVLALNTGLTVFMCVVLKYMLIWNFGNLTAKSYFPRNNNNTGEASFNGANWNATNAMDPSHGNSLLVTTTPSQWSLFMLLDCCFTVRLFVLVICLGNVHYASIKFNSKLSQALLQAQKITDLMEQHGIGNKYFQGRQVMTRSEANTVLAFITENSANPMAFSAAGLFCFSRNLILVIISIIITYLVFLLQV